MKKNTTDWRDLLHIRDVRSLLTGLLLVGSFVIFATTTISFLTSRKFLDGHYVLHVRFPDGTGLTKGGKVLLKGVQIGTLESIDFDENGQVVLALSLETRCADGRIPCRHNDLVRRGAVANVIRDRNLVSDRVVNIVDTLGSGRNPLEDGEWLASGTVLDVQATLDSLAALTQHLRNTLSQADTVLRMVSDTNGTLGALLVKKDLYLKTMEALTTVDQVASRSASVVGSFDRLGGSLERDIPRLVHKADTLVGSLAATSRKVDTIANSGMKLLQRGDRLADEADLLVDDGTNLLDRSNRMVDGLSKSWFLGGYLRPERVPEDRVPVGVAP